MDKLVKEQIINKALDRIQHLTNEDFHGYRSEMWGVIADVIRDTAKDIFDCQNKCIPIDEVMRVIDNEQKDGYSNMNSCTNIKIAIEKLRGKG